MRQGGRQWESSAEWMQAVLLGHFKASLWHAPHAPAGRQYARDWTGHGRIPTLRPGGLAELPPGACAWPHQIGERVGSFTCISWPRGLKRKRAAYRCQCGQELLAGWERIARGTARCTACDPLRGQAASRQRPAAPA